MMLRRKDWLGVAGWCFLAMVLGLSRLIAQSPSDRNVPYQRIFIPRSELSSLTPKDFVPVKIADLEQLLPRASAPLERTLGPSEPQITQLLLVASLVGEDLVSDVSRMVVQYDDDVRATLDATPLSLALRPPASSQSPEGKLGSGDALMFFSRDGLSHWSIDESTQLWFGWTQRPNVGRDRRGRQLDFELRVPATPDSRLLLKLPPFWKVEAEQAVALRNTSIGHAFPRDWPASRLGEVRETDNWWEVVFGGTSSLKIRLSRQEEQRSQVISTVLSNHDIHYDLSATGLTMTSRWSFHRATDVSRAWRIRLDPRLKIRDLRFQNKSMEWEQDGEWIDREQTDSTSNKSDGASEWTLIAAMEWNMGNDGLNPLAVRALPKMQVDGSYALQGTTSLSLAKHLKPQRVWSDRGALLATDAMERNAMNWISRWSGTPDEWIVESENELPQWKVETLTLIRSGVDSAIAQVHLQVQVGSVPLSLLPLQLGQGWAFESVTSPDARLQIDPSLVGTNENGSRWDLVLSPAIQTPSVQIDLQLRHSSATNAKSLHSIPEGQVVSVLGADQIDAFAIETGGEFSVRPSMSLLEHRRTERDLNAWQRSKLPRLADNWIIVPGNGILPSLDFEPQPASFTVDHNTTVRFDSDEIEIAYRIRCQPVSGSIQQLNVRFPSKLPGPIDWTLLQPMQANEERKVSLKASDSGPQTSQTAVEIRLDKAMAEPFDIEGRLRLPRSAPLDVPVLNVPEAYIQTALIHIDRNLRIVSKDQRLNEMPSIASFDQKKEQRSEQQELQTFSYDPKRSISMTILESAPPREATIWIEREQIEDVVLPSGQLIHWVHWIVEKSPSMPFRLKAPEGWRCESFQVDGKSCPFRTDTNDQTILVALRTDIEARRVVWSMKFIDDASVSIFRPSIPVAHQMLPGQTKWSTRTLWLPAEWGMAANSLLQPSPWYHRFQFTQFREALFPSPAGKSSSVTAAQDQTAQQLLARDREWMMMSPVWKSVPLEARIHGGLVSSNGQPHTLPLRWERMYQSWSLCCFLASLGMGLWILRHIKNLCWLSFLMVLLLIWVPPSYLEFAQASLAATLIAAAIQLSFRAVRERSLADQQSTVAKRASHASSRVASTMVKVTPLLIVFLFWGTTATAQTHSKEKKRTLPQAVILPIDASGNLDGNIAYIHSDFYRELTQAEDLDRPNSVKILGVRYQLSIPSPNLGSRWSYDLAIYYDVETTDKSDWFRVPLSIQQAQFGRFTVDESDVPFGSRLRWDDRELAWLPEREGRHKVKLLIHPTNASSQEEQHRILIDLIPIASAQLEMQAGNEPLTDLQIESLGQILNPAVGRFIAQLGPLSQLDVHWRNPLRKSNTKETSRIAADLFVDLKRTRPIASTVLKIAQSSNENEPIEIEGPSDWQPIGALWGDARLVSVSPASAIGRRRFRLAWQTSIDRPTDLNGREPSSSLRNIEVLWLADSENANMLSVPLVDVLGSRIEQRAITVSDAASVQWRLEGISSWTSIPMRSNRQVEWESADLNQSYSIPENAQPAVLRRIPSARQVSARTQTNILFQSSHLECRSTTTWNTPMAISNEIDVALPPQAVMMSGKINGGNAMWNQMNVKGTEMVRFFLSKNESMIQSLEWTYQLPTTVDRWQRIPISRVRGFDEGDHRVNAYSQDERTIEFQNVELWPSASSSIGSEEAIPSKNRRWLWSRRVPSTAYGSLDDATFPSFCMREHAPIEGKMVASLSPVGPSWQLHIDGKLASSSRKEIVLDLPTNLVHSLSNEKGNVSAHPGNASRSFMRVPLENSFFHFDCLLPLDSSNVLNLPDIRVVDGSRVMNFWKLPPSANGMRVVVETPGLEKVEDAQLQSEIAPWITGQRDSSSGLFAKRLDRISLRLEPAERASTIVSCKGVVQTLNVDRQFDWTLRCDYWLLPLNLGDIEIRTADGVKLVRATIHDRDATQVSEGFTRIETHPGDAPFLLSLLLQGGRDTLDQVRWRQSHALVDVTVDKVFWRVHLPNDRLTLGNRPVGRFAERSAWGQELLKDGLDLLSQGSNAMVQREAKYRHGWYLPWRQYLRQEIASASSAGPRSDRGASKELEDSEPWMVPLQRLEELDRKLEVTEEQKKGWNGLLSLSETMGEATYCWIDTASKPGKIGSLESQHRDGDWQLRAKPEAEGDWIAKAMWSGGTLLVFLLLWTQLAKWQAAFEFLQQRPWWLVTMSSVLFAIVFPGLNIGVVFGLLAVISVVQAYWIEWQRTRRLRRA